MREPLSSGGEFCSAGNPVVLWFMDSGKYAEEGKETYGYVIEEQNERMLSAYEDLCVKYINIKTCS